jgi:hypothetical protein
MGTANERTATDPDFYCDCSKNKKICKRPYPPDYYSIEQNKYLVAQHGENHRQTKGRSKKSLDAQDTGQY